MSASGSCMHGERKTGSVCNTHEFRTVAPLGLPHFFAPFFRYHERTAINEAFGQVDDSTLLKVTGKRFENLSENSTVIHRLKRL